MSFSAELFQFRIVQRSRLGEARFHALLQPATNAKSPNSQGVSRYFYFLC
jgi:hypothetical protein